MKPAMLVTLATICCLTTSAQDRKPRVEPVALEGGGSAFLITIPNTTSTTLEVTSNGFCRMSLDDVLEGPDHGGSSGTRAVAPGDSWREIVRLVAWPRDPSGRRPRNPRPETVSAYREVRADLTPGSHTVAFVCGGDWSEPLAFESHANGRH